MTVTYRLESDDLNEVAIAQIRLEVGDTSEERGIKPDGSNYQDDEIIYIYNSEAQIVGRAAARICEQMATAWSSVPRTMFGSLFDPRKITWNFLKQAERLRAQYGVTTTTGTAFSLPTKRA